MSEIITHVREEINLPLIKFGGEYLVTVRYGKLMINNGYSATLRNFDIEEISTARRYDLAKYYVKVERKSPINSYKRVIPSRHFTDGSIISIILHLQTYLNYC